MDSVAPIIYYRSRPNYCKGVLGQLGNEAYRMIHIISKKQCRLPRQTAVPQFTQGTVRSWFEGHEDRGETTVRNTFTPPASVKQLEDVLQGEETRDHLKLL